MTFRISDGKRVYEFVARFGGSIRLNAVQVGRALKELGFEMVHTRHGNFWVVVEWKNGGNQQPVKRRYTDGFQCLLSS